jgi:hypothetical protein
LLLPQAPGRAGHVGDTLEHLLVRLSVTLRGLPHGLLIALEGLRRPELVIHVLRRVELHWQHPFASHELLQERRSDRRPHLHLGIIELEVERSREV